MQDVVKQFEFRRGLIHFYERYLIDHKMKDHVVVMGNDFAMEAKYARGTLTIFDIVGFRLLIYEVPFITVPSIAVTGINLTKEIGELKQDQKRIDQTDIQIEAVTEGIYNREFMPYKQLVHDALKETLLFYAA